MGDPLPTAYLALASRVRTADGQTSKRERDCNLLLTGTKGKEGGKEGGLEP